MLGISIIIITAQFVFDVLCATSNKNHLCNYADIICDKLLFLNKPVFVLNLYGKMMEIYVFVKLYHPKPNVHCFFVKMRIISFCCNQAA